VCVDGTWDSASNYYLINRPNGENFFEQNVLAKSGIKNAIRAAVVEKSSKNMFST
jgi:hypothetical protein